MIVVCCICHRILKKKKEEPGMISHTICDRCLPGWQKEQETIIKKGGLLAPKFQEKKL